MIKRIRQHLTAIIVIALMAAAFVVPVSYAEMPELPRGKGEFCVEPTSVMRKNHMQFLLHQRDDTVLNGVRTSKHSLVGCVDCHVQSNQQQEFIPVDAPGQFCEVCHTFASVKLDCFECHATTPDEAHSAMTATKTKHHVAMSPINSVSGGLENEIREHLSNSTFGVEEGSEQQ